MYTQYASATVDELPWQEKDDAFYDNECSLKEHVIVVNTEETRDLIIQKGKPMYKKGRRYRGRALTMDIPELGLKTNDRIEPKFSLEDLSGFLDSPHNLETRPLPMKVVFWRPSFDRNARLQDGAVHRNPLFDFMKLGTSPHRTLCLDTLHSLYYGAFSRWTSCVLWRTVLSNPWRLHGEHDAKLLEGMRRLRADFIRWQQAEQVPPNRRIGDLTLSMIGDRKKCKIGSVPLHPGSMCKTKAAETRLLMKFAYETLIKIGLPEHQEDLTKAGQALIEYGDLTSATNDVEVAPHIRRKLMELCIEALSRMQRAKITDAPKLHSTLHMTFRFQGASNAM